MSIYYKMRLEADPSGLMIVRDKWVSIHETPCFAYCIPANRAKWVESESNRHKISKLKAAKNLKLLKRISKESSRFAFRNETKAMQNLRFLKSRQLKHLERQQKFIEKFLACDELESVDPDGELMRVPNSEDLVHKYYRFE
jgi:hypothetical protein